MAGQKKWGKNGYLQDFKGNATGGYTYTGETWRADETERRRLLVRLWVLQTVALAAACLPGFFTTAGLQNTFYVILPYVFWLLSDFYLIYVLGTMTLGGNPLRNYIYERTVARIIPCAVASLTGAVLTVLGLIIFLTGGGQGQGAAVCLLCAVLQGVCFFLMRKCDIAGIWTGTASGGAAENRSQTPQ